MPADADRAAIRRATDADADAVADVWLASFHTALPTVRLAHTDDEVRGWIRSTLIPECETWVAYESGDVVGVMALGDDELDQLYLRPDWRGRGLGDRFIALAKERRPKGLSLYAFQVNVAACHFYERHGFEVVDRNDGSRNEEKEPDVRYAWRPG
ncbi:MAG TPA: GNAT family N-acetyltransferase [Candidatus Limnocylindrales bacterium]|nr:GNAT family N-acetyltransferase [Candidatus Limnocylindrales bacterium]